MEELTLDEILDGRLRVFQKKRGYRFSLDAILLASFISLKAKSKAIDLGTGSGIIPLILAIHFPHVDWIGLEIQEAMAVSARRNVEINSLEKQIKIITGDAREIKKMFSENSFDSVVFNPPYRRLNSGRINPDQEKAIARHELQGSLEHFMAAAKYLLKPAGRVFTIYPAKRLAELVCLFRVNSIEPKRMRLVFSDSESAAEFVLLEGRSRSGEELVIEAPLFIYDQDKKYTRQMKNIFSGLAAAGDGG